MALFRPRFTLPHSLMKNPYGKDKSILLSENFK